MKLGRWADAQELVDEGIEFTKASHLEGHAERTCRKDMEFLKHAWAMADWGRERNNRSKGVTLTSSLCWHET